MRYANLGGAARPGLPELTPSTGANYAAIRASSLKSARGRGVQRCVVLAGHSS